MFITTWILSLEAAGQKKAISLLPSHHEILRRDMVADTGYPVQPDTLTPLLISDCPVPSREFTWKDAIREREKKKQPEKPALLLFRLIFPTKIMILDITADKP